MRLPIGLVVKVLIFVMGLISLALLVALGGQLLALGSWRPFENDLIRYITAALVLITGTALGTYMLWRRANNAKAIESALLAADKEPESDEKILAGKMKDALATLKASTGGDSANYLYDLPWYIIIGPPGSGKTTALVNSGLKFPLSRGATPAAVAGNGGTRYCDWWFTEDAVFIDTAGRYTTQDSDPKSDSRSWIAFLDILKGNRPHQPINGVIVAISLEDVLTATPAELQAHADAIRSRLIELHDRMKVDFPVYALFTKMDLVAGFSEFFDSLNDEMRRQVWGATFSGDDRKRNTVGDIPAEFDALLMRLNDLTTDRLQEEPTPSTRSALFAFPAQMARLRRPVHDFLNRIFEPTRYHANAMLRGFYFTSGTQEGTPIDQLIGALARNFGGQEVKSQRLSRLGKSYFLNNLLGKLIVGEANWVSVDAAALRRERLFRIGALGSLAALAAIVVFAWSVSFARNKQLILSADAAATTFMRGSGPVAHMTKVADRELPGVWAMLESLRALPTGYEERAIDTPLSETFGLSQRDRLSLTAVNSYRLGLERLFRPRLIYRLEEYIDQNTDKPNEIYEALKVYLVLTGAVPRREPELVLSWMKQDWERLYPGQNNNALAREKLALHLSAMLELGEGHDVALKPNAALVSLAQRTLARLSVAQRAYAMLRSQSSSANAPDWRPEKVCGDDFFEVFEGPRERLQIPGFLTYAGLHRAVLDRLPSIQQNLEQDRWVLGAAGDQAAVKEQYQSLARDVIALYGKDFAATWKAALSSLKLKSMIADKPKFLPLSIVSAVNSPLRCLLEQVRLETAVTQARKDFVSADKSNKPVVLANEVPGAAIENEFKPYHRLVEGDTKRQIDDVVTVLARLHETVRQAANPIQAPIGNASMPPLLDTLRSEAARMPSPFNVLIQGVASQFESDSVTDQVRLLRQKLGDEVTGPCNDLVKSYPFRDVQQEVSLLDFGRLFGPKGLLERFFENNLKNHVDRSRPQWTWRNDTILAKALSASPETIRHFQTAARIRGVYFQQSADQPAFSLSVTPPQLSSVQPSERAFGSSQLQIRLDLNGAQVTNARELTSPVPIQWPGLASGRSAVTVSDGGPAATLERRGMWSMFRLIEAGGGARTAENTIRLTHPMSKEIVVTYQITAGTPQNPFNLSLIREFACPKL